MSRCGGSAPRACQPRLCPPGRRCVTRGSMQGAICGAHGSARHAMAAPCAWASYAPTTGRSPRVHPGGHGAHHRLAGPDVDVLRTTGPPVQPRRSFASPRWRPARTRRRPREPSSRPAPAQTASGPRRSTAARAAARRSPRRRPARRHLLDDPLPSTTSATGSVDPFERFSAHRSRDDDDGPGWRCRPAGCVADRRQPRATPWPGPRARPRR